ncbi:cytochrome p450 [Hirsutella rhossiliensis]|uniref:Cytochrome p450 domain-containing protein n=1 Tax=Hirsutella rhossiliensis TaxID=111463 RepID=A0A9P8MN64_9HYPO|nr:cytochrome p450 domain-containing protein [Hirsutella rhossiliensis]KAH0958155.1 cytochrome p450 domain-containing protein [Hirsutella rhossiliensis]
MLLDANVHWTAVAWRAFVSAVACWALYSVAVYVYRLTLHPLAGYPGPKFAAASYLYEFWHDVVLDARYTEEIAKLHERYGPLIRINPHELHCSDPSFVDVLYPVAGNRRRNKTEHQMSGFGGLSLCGRGWFDAGGAFNCFTTDAIVEYCYGESPGFLDQEGWQPNCKDVFEALETRSHFTRHLPWLARSIMRTMSGTYDSPLRYHVQMPERLKRVIAVGGTDEAKTRPVFAELLRSDLPPHEKTPKRLAYDSNGAALAGPQSTATALSNIVYRLVKQPDIAKRLREEVMANVPDPKELPSWPTLEQLPYLSAVILEGLRLIFDFSQERLSYEPSQERLARVAVDEDLQYEDDGGVESGHLPAKTVYTIPRGTAVGMSACLVHLDESIFPEANAFRPERWLDDAGQRHSRLDRHLLSFSKGSRFCVGFQLAYCVLYVSVAELALRVLPRLEVRDRRRHGDEQVYNDDGEKEPRKTTKGYDMRVVDV